MMLIVILLVSLVLPPAASATKYYLSPTGSNGNNGTTPGTPWLTFSFAIGSGAGKAGCGDDLVLLDGVYGDGTSTGKPHIDSLVCTSGNEFTLRAANERRAKIADNGTGYALRVQDSAYIILDGLYTRSTDNNYLATTAESGETFFIQQSNHITARNNIAVNPNRYGNNHTFVVFESQDVLLEDNESYIFSRHCVSAGSSTRVVVRRQYCNPRGGKIPGGFSAGGQPLGSGDAVMSMYPCRDCILENSIADSTESPMFINEQNANFASSVLVKGNKVLGNICYACTLSNGIVPNARNVADLNHTPQDGLIQHNVFVNYRSNSPAILCLDCVNYKIDHNTVMGQDVGVSAAHGIRAGDQSAYGATPAQASVTITNNLVKDRPLNGFMVSGVNTWSGNNNRSYSNGTSFSPSVPSNWGTTYTNNPGYGTCHGLWVPDETVGKGQGTLGSDIGATILYRYVNGVLTTTQLWDQTTGAFPFGAADRDNVNRVAGKSLFDLHTRMGVKTTGCPFPAGYVTSGGGGGPANPATYQSGTGTTSASWSHAIDVDTQGLLVFVALHDTLGTVGAVTSVTGCGGENIPAIGGGASITTPEYRRIQTFGKLAPTPGSCTITVTTTGEVDFTVGTSIEIPVMGSFGTPTTGDAPPSTPTATPSLTVPSATTGMFMIGALGAKCNPVSNACTTTLSPGADQTWQTDAAHPTGDIRLATSTQDGAAGGVISWTMGTNNYWASVAVPILPSSPDPPSSAELTQDAYLFVYPYGTEANAPPIFYWLPDANAKNVPIPIMPGGIVRIRVQITGSVATTSPFGAALFCRKNADSYTKVLNTFQANGVRFFGAGAEGEGLPIPPSLTATSNRLCESSCVPGAVIRDSASTFVVPALTVGQHLEIDSVVKIEDGLSGTVDCRYEKDNGDPLTNYTVTPRLNLVPSLAGSGF